MSCGRTIDGVAAPQDGAPANSAYMDAVTEKPAGSEAAKGKGKNKRSKKNKSAASAASAAPVKETPQVAQAAVTTGKKGKQAAKPPMNKRKKITIIAACVLGALLLVIGIAFLSTPKGVTDIGEGYEISGQRIAYSEGAFYIKGTAKNTTGHDEAFTMNWKVYNSDDEEIGQATVTTNPLADGQSEEFQAQITSNTTMFDMMMNGGQTAQNGGPDHFELSEVTLYTETANQFSSPFGDFFGGFDWFF